MNVYGYEVPDKVEQAVLSAMKGVFMASNIEDAAVAAGAPRVINGEKSWCAQYLASRIADRIIQRERKAGRIVRYGRGWQRA